MCYLQCIGVYGAPSNVYGGKQNGNNFISAFVGKFNEFIFSFQIDAILSRNLYYNVFFIRCDL